jgi:CheY-like chemotaxis protein
MWQAIETFLSTLSAFFRNRGAGSSGRLPPDGKGAFKDRITVVSLVGSERDRRLLAGIGSQNQWNVFFAETCEEARAALDRLRAPVILCDRDLPGSKWRDAVEALSASPQRPCIILTSRVVDQYLLNEVIRRGGYDVLSNPLREEEVIRTVKLALSYWNRPMRTEALSAKGRWPSSVRK